MSRFPSPPLLKHPFPFPGIDLEIVYTSLCFPSRHLCAAALWQVRNKDLTRFFVTPFQ